MRYNFADFPFAPRRVPFFYGWVIVAVSTLVIIASIPGQTMAVGVFTDSLIEALGVTRGQLSLAYMLGTVASGFMLPLAGRLLDKFGVRVMAIFASIGLAAGLVAMSRSDRMAQAVGAALPDKYMIYAVMTIITLCFLLVRFFGQGSLTMIGRVAMGKWFNHRRGIATAISGVFVTFGFSGAPWLLNRLIGLSGWRWTCVILAAGVAAVVSVIACVFYRDNPEQCGLVMDGVSDEAWLAKQSETAPEIKKELTRTEAIRTRAFWAFTLGLASYGMVITAVCFHLTSLAEEMGRSKDSAFAIFLPMSFVGVIARFGSSWLCDRTSIKLKWHLVVMMVSQSVGTLGVLLFGSTLGWGLVAVGYGITGGLMGALLNIAWPRFFGREHLGAISGLNMSIMVWASAIGPLLFSFAEELTGNYNAAIIICAILPLIIILDSLKADNPQESL
jgi:MFS family permease